MTDTSNGNNGRVLPLQVHDLSEDARSVFLPPPPTALFHYTTYDGIRGIVESRSLRLTKFAYLNDTTELHHAIRLFKAIADNVGHSAPPAHRELLERTAVRLNSFEQTNICVASFCENGDLLSQWRGYGSAVGSVALRFRTSALTEIAPRYGARLLKCIYHRSHHALTVRALINQLVRAYDIASENAPPEHLDNLREGVISGFSSLFLQVAPAIKDEAFEAEHEWRLVTMPRRTTDPRYRAIVGASRIATYYKADFIARENGRFDFLEGLVVGPANPEGRELVSDALAQLCHNNSVDIQSIIFSRIPYRG